MASDGATSGGVLPIDEVLDAALERLAGASALVIEAPPGAGKTTRVPVAILERTPLRGEVVVLQPRRLAARMSARRVAELLGERPGQRCGYQVRFESLVSPQTRIRFMTEGLLLRRLRDDPTLRGVDVLVLDEFHERHLDGDLALALARALQRGPRPDLKIVVMSATLEGAPIARYLGDDGAPCPQITSVGRAFPVAITHLEASEVARPLPRLVLRALHQLIEGGLDGDVLVFLPGTREIREAATACAGLCESAGLLALPLHGELPPAEQDRAVRPAAQRKLILSTNVAETSITIDGVVAVIDGGLHRTPSHDPWSGIPTLELAKIARDSAAQRAGRAGRTRPGRCVRLYTQADHDRRPAHGRPEVERLELSGALLELHAAGYRDPRAFPWLSPPPDQSLEAGEALLRRLGAVTGAGALTDVGRSMLAYPLHPRLARLLVEGGRRDIAGLSCDVAALLGERSVRRDRGAPRPSMSGAADVLAELDDLESLRRAGAGAAARLGLSRGACDRVERARRQLRRIARERGGARARTAADEEVLGQALLAAYPDRVAQVRREDDGAATLVLCGGGSARLDPASVVVDADWALALEVEARGGPGRGRQAWVRSACAIEPEWLLEGDALVEEEVVAFDDARGRVVGHAALRYEGLTLERTPLPPERLAQRATATLQEAARAAGLARFTSTPALTALRARCAFLAAHVEGLADLPGLVDDPAAFALLAALCEGRSSFAELERADLVSCLRGQVEAAAPGALDRLAPEHVPLAGGRRLAVRYEVDRPPWAESRLQDFFGAAVGPTVAAGRVFVVLHLLAPNKRAVQVTTDLAGFWSRHYAELRRSLMRRYPKHAWPEDPITATPPAPGRLR
ncbi:MAG: ATP-dependent helicase HrpB [Nannocystaceae bacterium]